MSNRKQDNTDGNDSELDRALALASHAYKNVGADVPTPAMDDAIRAAARRVVRSQPHAINKPWISRWSMPISAAALVVLSVSVGLIAVDEQPDRMSASLKEVVRPKAAIVPATPPMPAAESAAPVARIASDLPQPARTLEKKARLDLQSVAPRDQVATSAKPTLELHRNEADATASGSLVTKDSDDALASPAITAFVPAPPLAEVATRRESAGQRAAETLKREAPQIKQLVPQVAAAAVAARGDVGSPALQKSVAAANAPAAASRPSKVAGNAAVEPPVHAVPAAPSALADKASEAPDVWMKRILELKRLERTREFEDELVKFRKRYPDFVLPEALK